LAAPLRSVVLVARSFSRWQELEQTLPNAATRLQRSRHTSKGCRLRQAASSFGQKWQAKGHVGSAVVGRFVVSRIARLMPCLIVAAVGATVSSARAQANLDRGKSAAQIFADTCNACHRSPREIRPTSAAFLREHYTTGAQQAAVMAAYLASVGSDSRAVQQRRPPTLGAGQAPSPGVDESKGADNQAAPPGSGPTAGAVRPRRPSESVEVGNLPVGPAQGGGAVAGPPEAAAGTPARQPAVDEFEE
jgi:hypothetical protein